MYSMTGVIRREYADALENTRKQLGAAKARADKEKARADKER